MKRQFLARLPFHIIYTINTALMIAVYFGPVKFSSTKQCFNYVSLFIHAATQLNSKLEQNIKRSWKI